jgi:hypothetical protein
MRVSAAGACGVGTDDRSCDRRLCQRGPKSPKVIRLFTACEDRSAMEYRYTVIPGEEDVGFYLFATAAKLNSGNDKSGLNKADLLLRNAVYEVLKR